ncbi:MAG: hypothetical protein ABIR91_00450 [Candidatus Saccharimonadales bacterium]
MGELEGFVQRFCRQFMPSLKATGHADPQLLKYLACGDLDQFLRLAQYQLIAGKLIEPGYHDIQQFRRNEALPPMALYPLLLREAVNSILYRHYLEGKLGHDSGRYYGWVHSALPWH